MSNSTVHHLKAVDLVVGTTVAQRLRERASPPRRKRGPTLAAVARQASRAGIEVARYEVRPDGTIAAVVGKPVVGTDDTTSPVDRSEWN